MATAAATEACRAWGSLRGCRFGDTCKFTHVGEQGAVARKKAAESAEVCRAWTSENGCRYENCPYKHEGPGKKAAPREKSDEVCRAWKSERGCKRGAECRFNHEGETGKLSAEERAARRAANPKPAAPAKETKAPKDAKDGEEKKRRPRRSRRSPKKEGEEGAPKVCRFFNKPEGCKLGDTCTYLHVAKTA